MYLKSIEMQGFKSFASKMTLDFHSGITGIVGPNGSGKSNVADAVRWVLGEQRIKQLRGGAMQDIIFAGTENRRPLSYASVAITLDNSDHWLSTEYNEVTVTRRLYRSGESEYLLNGTACRLKDIQELFYDTGIGKEGYSIIGQGQIEQILSGKPEERRELFDEASGIVKFKRRKAMSIRKLEHEQSNLVRITDVLSELERQVEPLKQQSIKAKEYISMKQELRTYDINQFLLETESLKKQLRDTEEKLSFAEEQLAEINQEYDASKTEYEKIVSRSEEIEQEIEKSRQCLNDITLSKQQMESEIELFREQIRSARSNEAHVQERMTVLETEIQERKQEQKKQKQEQEKLHALLQERDQTGMAVRGILNEIQSKMAELQEIQEESKQEIVKLLETRVSTRANIERYDGMLEQLQVRKAEMNNHILTAVTQEEEQVKQLSVYEKEAKRIADAIQKQEKEQEQLEKEIQTLQDRLQKQTEERKQGQEEYHRELSRLESLKNITERYDGYGNSIRRVMEKKEKESGLLGVVADLIQVEQEYETAVETALGGNIQNIVTDNEETARNMIAYLKKNRFGRATFLPLTAMKVGERIRYPEVLQETGVIGTADTLVKTEGKYKPVVKWLLGRTVVVDHIDHAIGVARKYKQALRLVTKEGELINPGGAMTGGAFKNSSNLLGRRREIEELEKVVKDLKKRLEKTEKAIEEDLEKKNESDHKLEEMKQELHKAYVVKHTAELNVEKAREDIRESRERIEAIQLESKSLEEQKCEIVRNQKAIEKELATSEDQGEKLQKKIAQAKEAYEKEKEKEQVQQKACEEANLSFAGLEQKQEFLAETLERIRQEQTKYEEEMEQLKKNRSLAVTEIDEKEEKISRLQTEGEEAKEKQEKLQKEIEEYTKQKEALTGKNKKFLERREELSGQRMELEKERIRLNSRKENCEKATQQQIDYMWEEYELTYNNAMKLRDGKLTDLNKIKKEIQQLRDGIRGLGDVNVNAIEEYRQLSERYEFLKEQHADLTEAEATLKKVITELDAAMRKQFREQFSLISREFQKAFQQLFGGGKGTLELEEEEDILEAGIRVVAQPPGKKLQNMMQLSGGEKALTAIALLFAIQNLKPSPFCLLDEIEAALDDGNVGRFTEYLQKLTKHTQFIVITHRKGTMTASDRLYGITMQEKGISTLVSVNLVEGELEK